MWVTACRSTKRRNRQETFGENSPFNPTPSYVYAPDVPLIWSPWILLVADPGGQFGQLFPQTAVASHCVAPLLYKCAPFW